MVFADKGVAQFIRLFSSYFRMCENHAIYCNILYIETSNHHRHFLGRKVTVIYKE